MGNRLLTLLAVLMLGANAYAARIEQPLPDAARETQARALFHALRCVVCEGQSLADSDATLAVQMRDHIRTMLSEGKTPEEIIAFFRAHYGERILMTPPVDPSTALLWALPVLLLLAGGIAVWRTTRPREGDSA